VCVCIISCDVACLKSKLLHNMRTSCSQSHTLFQKKYIKPAKRVLHFTRQYSNTFQVRWTTTQSLQLNLLQTVDAKNWLIFISSLSKNKQVMYVLVVHSVYTGISLDMEVSNIDKCMVSAYIICCSSTASTWNDHFQWYLWSECWR